MPVIRVDNYIDAYRIRARTEDMRALAARPGKESLTEVVSRRILDVLKPVPEDVLVDIGCGDGTLVKMARGTVSKCIGIVASEEERGRLQEAISGCQFIATEMRGLPLETGSVSKIVCNGVLIYLSSKTEVAAAIQEMARISRPGATIWIGEIPDLDEYAEYGMYRGKSMLAFLAHLLRNNGVRAFAGMCRRWCMALLGRDQIVLNSARIFFAPPSAMIGLGESSGLKLKSYFRHQDVDEHGEFVDSRFRYDYVFEK